MLPWFLERRKENKQRWNDGSREAADLVSLLERFARKCASGIDQNRITFSHFEGHGEVHWGVPKLDDLSNIEWKLLDSHIKLQVRSLQDQIEVSQEGCDFVAREMDPTSPDVNFCNQENGLCGFMAYQIAHDLRKRYKHPTWEHGWDIPAILKEYSDARITRADP
jgi:hypothetical protein